MKHTKLFLAMATASLVMPLSAFAAKPVSQDFTAPATYFDLPGDKARVLAGTEWYSSATPWAAIDWTNTGTTFDRGDDLAFDITTPTVTFGNFDYVGIVTDTPGDMSWDPVTTEIWRMSRTNPHKFTQVYSLDNFPTEQAITDLVVFNGKLFASTDSGYILKSVNGKDWTSVTTTGLPTTGYMGDLTTSDTKMYVVMGNAVYSSKNGKKWTEVTGKYNNTSASVVSVSAFETQLFVVTSNNDGSENVWKRRISGTWKKIMHNAQDMTVNANPSDVVITKQQNVDGGTITSKVFESNNGKQFVKTYTTDGWVAKDSLISVGGTNLIVVNNAETAQLVRL